MTKRTVVAMRRPRPWADRALASGCWWPSPGIGWSAAMVDRPALYWLEMGLEVQAWSHEGDAATLGPGGLPLYLAIEKTLRSERRRNQPTKEQPS